MLKVKRKRRKKDCKRLFRILCRGHLNAHRNQLSMKEVLSIKLMNLLKKDLRMEILRRWKKARRRRNAEEKTGRETKKKEMKTVMKMILMERAMLMIKILKLDLQQRKSSTWNTWKKVRLSAFLSSARKNLTRISTSML